MTTKEVRASYLEQCMVIRGDGERERPMFSPSTERCESVSLPRIMIIISSCFLAILYVDNISYT